MPRHCDARNRVARAAVSARSTGARRSRAKFGKFFKRGFHDPLYIDWERDYKWEAHKRWEAALSRPAFSELLLAGKYADIAAQAVAIEARTNLLFSFEKMAIPRRGEGDRPAPAPLRKDYLSFFTERPTWTLDLRSGATWSAGCPGDKRVS